MSVSTVVFVGGPDDGRTFEYDVSDWGLTEHVRWRDGEPYYFVSRSAGKAYVLYSRDFQAVYGLGAAATIHGHPAREAPRLRAGLCRFGLHAAA